MFNIVLASRREDNAMFLFSLFAIDTLGNAAETRREILQHTCFTSVLFVSDAHEHVYAATLYHRLRGIVPSELPQNRYTLDQMSSAIVNRTHAPAECFLLRERNEDDTAGATIARWRWLRALHWWWLRALRIDFAPSTLLARDARTIQRDLRTAATSLAVTVHNLFDADKLLAEAFRRKCGLSRHEASGYLADYNMRFRTS